MMDRRDCDQCGEDYQPRNTRSRYCKPECSKKGYALSKRKYELSGKRVKKLPPKVPEKIGIWQVFEFGDQEKLAKHSDGRGQRISAGPTEGNWIYT